MLYTGVVEDLNDPLKLGRVRARYFSIHTEKKTIGNDFGIPTSDLPWSSVMMPVTSASISGIGDTPRILNGSWVVAFFRDESMQDPVIIGTVPAIQSEKPSIDKGFSDPSGQYPKDDFINESDLNRLARNEKIEQTIFNTKAQGREEAITKADGSTWDEPEQSYAAIYPFNRVSESESGHIHEIDDTPDNERLHTYHKAGTFSEIHPDGSKVLKIVGKSYTLILDGENIYIDGDSSETITGDKLIKANNLNINIGTSANITIPATNWEGNILFDGNVTVTGNINATGNIKGENVSAITEVTAKVDGAFVKLSTHLQNGVPPTPFT
tara:strand:+ start:2459 stop:3433 length:975 start_codon:yes stop_codon:yes gene_type:complete